MISKIRNIAVALVLAALALYVGACRPAPPDPCPAAGCQVPTPGPVTMPTMAPDGPGAVDLGAAFALPDCEQAPGGIGPCAIVWPDTADQLRWWYVRAGEYWPADAVDLGTVEEA